MSRSWVSLVAMPEWLALLPQIPLASRLSLSPFLAHVFLGMGDKLRQESGGHWWSDTHSSFFFNFTKAKQTQDDFAGYNAHVAHGSLKDDLSWVWVLLLAQPWLPLEQSTKDKTWWSRVTCESTSSFDNLHSDDQTAVHYFSIKDNEMGAGDHHPWQEWPRHLRSSEQVRMLGKCQLDLFLNLCRSVLHAI